MKASAFKLEEKSLKDYILVTRRIGELSTERVDKVLDRYIKTTDKMEKDTFKRVLIEFNLKYAITVAARYRGAGLSFSSLIKLANKGLIKAVKNFPKAGDESFISFINWNIEGAIIEGLLKNKKKAAQKTGE